MIISLASASASPGVSTTALALTLLWKRDALLVEADTTGYSPTLAGFFQGQKRQTSSLLDLASATDFEDHLIENSYLLTDEKTPLKKFIPAITNPKHAYTITSQWPSLLQELSSLDSKGVDIILDLGRINSQQFPIETFQASDLAMLLLTPGIPEVMAAKNTLASLRLEEMNSGDINPLQIITISAPKTYSPREVSKVLNLPVLHSIPHQTEHAAVFSHGANRSKHFDSSSYIKSLSHLAETAYAQANKYRSSINAES